MIAVKPINTKKINNNARYISSAHLKELIYSRKNLTKIDSRKYKNYSPKIFRKQPYNHCQSFIIITDYSILKQSQIRKYLLSFNDNPVKN
jgi:hypothetical protein